MNSVGLPFYRDICYPQNMFFERRGIFYCIEQFPVRGNQLCIRNKRKSQVQTVIKGPIQTAGDLYSGSCQSACGLQCHWDGFQGLQNGLRLRQCYF